MDGRRVGRTSNELLRDIVLSSGQGFLVLDTRSRGLEIVLANSAYANRCGFSPSELEGSAWLSYAAAEPDSPEFRDLQTVTAGDAPAELDLPFLRKDGDVWLARLRLTPLDAGEPGRYLLVEHLADLSTVRGGTDLLRKTLGVVACEPARIDRPDPVTGLMSRGQFDVLLRRELAAAKRDRKNLCLTLFSIPELDVYRRTFGDNAADSCLRMVAAQLTGTFRRSTDLCVRFDESRFAIALTGQCADQARELADLVEKKTRNLGLHNPRGRLSRYVVIRSSITVADLESDDFASLIERAAHEIESADEVLPEAAAGSG